MDATHQCMCVRACVFWYRRVVSIYNWAGRIRWALCFRLVVSVLTWLYFRTACVNFAQTAAEPRVHTYARAQHIHIQRAHTRVHRHKWDSSSGALGAECLMWLSSECHKNHHPPSSRLRNELKSATKNTYTNVQDPLSDLNINGYQLKTWALKYTHTTTSSAQQVIKPRFVEKHIHALTHTVQQDQLRAHTHTTERTFRHAKL